MNKMLDNLTNELKNKNLVSDICEHYDYIKVDTTYLIDYCDEYLVLYLRFVDDGVFVTDLKGVYEDSKLNNISESKLKISAESYGLKFEDNQIFAFATYEDVSAVIQCFFDLMKDLGL